MKRFRQAFANAIGIMVLLLLGVGRAAASDALGSYLGQNGYCSTPLFHPINYFHLRTRLNGNVASLIVDTGAPETLIFRSSLKRLGLVEQKTNRRVIGALGRGTDVFGMASIKTLTPGTCGFTDVPVLIANGRGETMLDPSRPDGVFGLHELIRYGAVLDLKDRAIYLQTGPTKKNSGIRSILLQQGYTPVPISIVEHHLLIRASLNGVACRMIVDTGAYLTAFNSDFITHCGFKTVATPFIARGLAGSTHVRMVKFNNLRLENYEILNGSATVAPLNSEIFNSKSGIAGLIGAEYLGMNWAVFDFSDGTMYLRPKR